MIKSVLQSPVCFLNSKVLVTETFTKLLRASSVNIRHIHITSTDGKEYRVGNVKVRVKNDKNELLGGENSIAIEGKKEKMSMFPNASTLEMTFDGIPYKFLHIINIKATPNNTIISTTNYLGLGILLNSAGIEGFKNAKKGTNIAAQLAAYNLGLRTIEKGIKTVRIRVQGLGPGRMSAMKGLELSGLNIVSITDDTRVSWNPQRPRKQRRI